MTPSQEHTFDLYDLRVETIEPAHELACSHTVGDYFIVEGENISFPNGKPFSMYALAALLPFLPAKQRDTHLNDWMTTDDVISCPDPHCGGRFRISRTGKRTLEHSAVTKVPLEGG